MKMANRIIDLGRDLKRLFIDWGTYYSSPVRWKLRGWVYTALFASVVVIAFRFDEPIRYFFFALHTHFADRLAGYLHWYGTGYATLYVFLGLYLCGLLFNFPRTRLKGIMVLQAYLYSGLITISLKSLVGRFRPFAGKGFLAFTPLVAGPNSHLSFPSGDVAVAFSLSIILAGFSRNWVWRSVWIIIAMLTSLSRMYYDAHWFSDVIFSTVNASAAAIWLLRSHEDELVNRPVGSHSEGT
ncbi:MAG TPA: phosphatase PAP2 family protein [Candidatus Kryptonia bacterium]